MNSSECSAQFWQPMERAIFKVCILLPKHCFFTRYNCCEVLVMGLAMDTITPLCSTSAIDRTFDSDKVLGLFDGKMETSHWCLSLSFSPCRPIL